MPGSEPTPSAWWRSLISGGADSRRFLLLLLIGALAVQAGFVAVSTSMANRLVMGLGYYYILGVFLAFLFFAWRVASERRTVWSVWLRNPGWPGLCILAGTILLLISDPFGHKVLFDEYVLQSTAQHIHQTKEIGTSYRAFNLDGTFTHIDTFLDKRPYFFVFLLSLLHDVSGFRMGNIFILNACLVPVFLCLVYYLAKALSDRRGGMLAVVLLSTLPLLSQNATGAGMELHNLTLLAATMCAALLYLRVPDAKRLGLLCLSAVLLSQSRYESAVYAAPVALVILAGWQRTGKPLLTWMLIVTPLLFVPYAWHNRVLSASPVLWQLNEGQTARFSVEYLSGNLEGLWRFFANTGIELPNSIYLSLLGFGALGFLLVSAFMKWRSGVSRFASPQRLVLVLFGLGVAANLGLLMFYYWARLDDVSAMRFSLPAYLMLALCSAACVHELSLRWPRIWMAAMIGAGAYLLVFALPAEAQHRYTSQNLVAHIVDWELELVEGMPAKPRLIMDNRSTMPWILHKIPSVILPIGRLHAEKVRYHMEQGTFQEVLVVQTLRPISPDGLMGLDAEDVLPPAFHLETVAEKRFGINLCRISRILRIDPAVPGTPN